MMSKDVIDLFEQEVNKKEFKEDKKIAKRVAKEKKREKKKEKKLEKIEDLEFAKKLEEKKESDIINKDDLITEKTTTETYTRSELNVNKKIKTPILNFFLVISVIILFISSVDYAIYNIIKEKDLEIILTSASLCLLAIFYILSIITKNIKVKKFFQILATISISAYMCYQLFII